MVQTVETLVRKIGFIGLGIMGKPMAKNLLKKGHSVVCHDINPEAVSELVSCGAEAGRSAKDVAEKCCIIITMLPDSPQVKEVVLGSGGIIEGAKRGTIYIDMSSINPLVSREVSNALETLGVTMLDAPVSGGEPKAVDGTLAIMAGGSADTFDAVRDILGAMGSNIVHVGDIGSGNIAKLANQIIVAINIAAVSEALVLASKAGVDPQKVFDAIKGGLAGSAVMNAKAPMMLAHDFKPGFRLELHIKDLANVLSAAHETGAPVPLTEQVMEAMQALKSEGMSDMDHSALVRYYEKLASIEI